LRDDWSECKSYERCPIDNPHRCSDGSCKALRRSTSTEVGCEPFIFCSKFKPYKCADGSCAGDASLCSVLSPCDVDEIRC